MLFRSFILAFAALAGTAIAAFAQPAATIPDYRIQVGPWAGEATYSDGQFLSCVVYLDTAEGQGVAFGIGPSLRLGIEVMDLDWKMKRDRAATLTILIDGRVAVRQAGAASHIDQIGATFDDPETLLDRLAGGHSLAIEAEGSRISLPMPETYAAIVEASRCTATIAGLDMGATGRPVLAGRMPIPELDADAERMIAKAVLESAGIASFEFEPTPENRQPGRGLRWQLAGAVEGYLEAVRDTPAQFAQGRADLLARMARRDCVAEPRVEILDRQEQPQWSGLRMVMSCDQLEGGGGRLSHYSIGRYGNGVGVVMATELRLDDLATDKAIAAAAGIDEAIWRSAAFRRPPPP